MFKEAMRAGLVLVALALLGCSAGDKSEEVSATDFGEDWPFTVESVELFCKPHPPKAYVKAPDGTFYALNASAKGAAKEHGWSDVGAILKPSRWVKGLPADYSSVSQRAIDLCPKP